MNLEKKPVALLLAALGGLATVPAAHAAISIGSAGQSYLQDFDTLTTSTSATTWVNDSTLAGWSLFAQPAPGTAITSYLGGDGTGNTGSFYSFGAVGSGERALGGLGSGGAYFGSPASAAVAGWITAAFSNSSGQALDGFTLGFTGEQWRNGGNTSAQTMVFEYGFGSSFAGVATWTAPGSNFDWSSPVFSSTAAAVNGNTAGNAGSHGGTISAVWDPGTTLWVRWVERNDVGNDHGLAIDNVSFTAGPIIPVPEPAGLVLMAAGLAAVAGLRRRMNGGR